MHCVVVAFTSKHFQHFGRVYHWLTATNNLLVRFLSSQYSEFFTENFQLLYVWILYLKLKKKLSLFSGYPWQQLSSLAAQYINLHNNNTNVPKIIIKRYPLCFRHENPKIYIFHISLYYTACSLQPTLQSKIFQVTLNSSVNFVIYCIFGEKFKRWIQHT